MGCSKERPQFGGDITETFGCLYQIKTVGYTSSIWETQVITENEKEGLIQQNDLTKSEGTYMLISSVEKCSGMILPSIFESNFDTMNGSFCTVQCKQSANLAEQNVEMEVQQVVAGSALGVQRLVATSPAASSAGYHTNAQHPKELDDGKTENDQHGISQHILQEVLQLGFTTFCVKQIQLIQAAGALRGAFIFTAGPRHCVVAGKPCSVGPAGVVVDTTALHLTLQHVYSLGFRILSIVL